MLKIALMLLACGQFTVTVMQPVQRFTVEVQTKTKTTANKIVQKTVTTTRRPDYVAVFTLRSCGPCHSWINTEKRKLEARGITVVQVDMSDPANAKWNSKVSRYPTFWVCDGESKTRIESIVGYTSSDTLFGRVESRTKIKENPRKTVEKTKTTAVGMSQAGRIQLHNRLHGGGSWTWPGNLEQHLRQVHGVETR